MQAPRQCLLWGSSNARLVQCFPHQRRASRAGTFLQVPRPHLADSAETRLERASSRRCSGIAKPEKPDRHVGPNGLLGLEWPVPGCTGLYGAIPACTGAIGVLRHCTGL